MPEAVIDASAMVDLLIGSAPGPVIARRLRAVQLHAPAHFDAEVLSALGRLQRAERLTPRQVGVRLERLAAAPITRHPLPPLVQDAWRRRHDLRLVDALYVGLAHSLDLPLVTTDAKLAAASSVAELVTAPA